MRVGAGPETTGTGSFCQPCGAWRGSLGLEPTIDLFVAHMVEIFREVRRVLKPSGVCFLNLGDSYSGLKPKDLCGIPWRVAFALQADGWWLRSDIIWAKPNPMPESCTDRPTQSHEYIFLLTKSAKYFWDMEAVREPGEGYGRSERFRGDKYSNNAAFDNDRQWKNSKGGGKNSFDGSGRNLRTVWTFPTEAFPEAHFATYPTELVRRCVLAGTSEKGVCPKCGKPWRRVVEKTKTKPTPNMSKSRENQKGKDSTFVMPVRYEIETQTLGWTPTCACNAGEPIPATVLDPFLGSGTTALVAAKLGRDAVGIELNPAYVKMAKKRIFNAMKYDVQTDSIKMNDFEKPEKKGFIF